MKYIKNCLAVCVLGLFTANLNAQPIQDSKVDCIANSVAEAIVSRDVNSDTLVARAIKECIDGDYTCTSRNTGGDVRPRGVNDCAKCTRNTCWSCCDEFTNYPNKAFLDCFRGCCDPQGYDETRKRCVED